MMGNMNSSRHAARDVSPILKRLGVLKESPTDAIPPDRCAGTVFLEAMRDQGRVSECVSLLFPAEIPTDKAFFDQLSEFHRWIGHRNEADEAIGLVWSEAMRRIPGKQQDLLNAFARQSGHDFFQHARSLPEVMKHHALDANFLAEWFTELLQAVERDFVQDGVWRSIQAVCDHHHSTAITVLRNYGNSADPRRCNIAGFILALLREQSLDAEQRAALTQIDEMFRDNVESRLREVYNWSWVTAAQLGAFDNSELDILYSRAARSPDDMNSIMSVICRLISIGRLTEETRRKCREWVSARVTCGVSSDAKYRIADAAYDLIREEIEAVEETAIWLQTIQPVHESDSRTWDTIGDYLCVVLTHDLDLFSGIMIQLCDKSASTIHRLMAGRGMQHLLHGLASANVETLVSRLALAVDTPTRRLGLFLFKELEISVLSESALESCALIAPRLLFYETQRRILDGTTLGRLFAALEPHVESCTAEFQAEFIAEIQLQCRNFSGSFRKELESLGSKRPMLSTALKESDNHFEALKLAHKAGVNAMEVSGLHKAARVRRRLFARQVSDAAKAASPILSIAKEVALLYGRASSQFANGQLQDAVPLVPFSSSIEIPIVDFFDPEEMAVRRLHASRMIDQLIRDQRCDCEVSDDC